MTFSSKTTHPALKTSSVVFKFSHNYENIDLSTAKRQRITVVTRNPKGQFDIWRAGNVHASTLIFS